MPEFGTLFGHHYINNFGHQLFDADIDGDCSLASFGTTPSPVS